MSPGLSPSNPAADPEPGCSGQLGGGPGLEPLGPYWWQKFSTCFKSIPLGKSHHRAWGPVAPGPPLAEEQRSEEEWRQPDLGGEDVD